MTEDEVRHWLTNRFGNPAVDALGQYVELIRRENEQQNLVSRATLPSIWSRHILDSAQLIPLAPASAKRWCDIGSGAGLPGVVAGILHPIETWLVEPRRKRADFLSHVVATLGLNNVRVLQSKIEAVEIPHGVDVISARAVANLSVIFDLTRKLATPGTRFILPKGRSGHEELALAKRDWQGVFHVEQSVSDAESIIVIADGVTRRCSASR